jgi:hypothetical protein
LRGFAYLPVFKSILEFDHQVLSFSGAPTDQAAIYTHDPKSMWNASWGTPGFVGEIWVNWSTGDAARRLWALPPEQRFEASLEQVRLAAGDNGIRYRKAAIHDWANDPYAMGAYGYEKIAGLTEPPVPPCISLGSRPAASTPRTTAEWLRLGLCWAHCASSEPPFVVRTAGCRTDRPHAAALSDLSGLAENRSRSGPSSS